MAHEKLPLENPKRKGYNNTIAKRRSGVVNSAYDRQGETLTDCKASWIDTVEFTCE